MRIRLPIFIIDVDLNVVIPSNLNLLILSHYVVFRTNTSIKLDKTPTFYISKNINKCIQ